MEVINKHEIPVIEDNPYGELRYEGEFLPALKSLDTKALVIYLGTFSKIFCQGYRLGWVCAPKEILKKFITCKENSDLQTSTIGQRELSKYIDDYDIDEHVEKVKATYKKRRDLMLSCMKEEFPKGVSFTNPSGGFFFPSGNKENYFRLNYSSCKEDKIIEGIKRLGKVLNEGVSETVEV